MRNFQDGAPLFDATLALEQEPLTSPALVRLLFAYPLMTVKVIAAIHWQAAKLWWKKTPFHAHPPLVAAPGTPP
jgi:DUF1365 family protein